MDTAEEEPGAGAGGIRRQLRIQKRRSQEEEQEGYTTGKGGGRRS